jgi:hypothetical protein
LPIVREKLFRRHTIECIVPVLGGQLGIDILSGI